MQPMENDLQSIAFSYLGQDLSTVKAKAPLRFWEIPEFFKCPVVGMCMTLTEQKQLLKKTKISVKNTSPFEIHSETKPNRPEKCTGNGRKRIGTASGIAFQRRASRGNRRT